MLEENGLENEEEIIEQAFPISVPEALSIYTLYSIFKDDVLAGIEDGISKHEIPPRMRADMRALIPRLLEDLRDFITDHASPEVVKAMDAQISESKGDSPS